MMQPLRWHDRASDSQLVRVWFRRGATSVGEVLSPFSPLYCLVATLPFIMAGDIARIEVVL